LQKIQVTKLIACQEAAEKEKIQIRMHSSDINANAPNSKHNPTYREMLSKHDYVQKAFDIHFHLT